MRKILYVIDGARVTGTITHQNSAIYRLVLSNDEEFTTTVLHPFYSLDKKRWTRTYELVPGERLVTQDGEISVKICERIPGVRQVYNLEINGLHNYYVGKTSLLSHNTSGCGPGGGKPIHSRYEDGTPVYTGEQPPRLTPGPDPNAVGPHSRLRWDNNNERVYQGREFDANGYPVRDVDFTSRTFSNGAPRPGHAKPGHQHKWIPNDPNNPKAGFKRGGGEDL